MNEDYSNMWASYLSVGITPESHSIAIGIDSINFFVEVYLKKAKHKIHIYSLEEEEEVKKQIGGAFFRVTRDPKVEYDETDFIIKKFTTPEELVDLLHGDEVNADGVSCKNILGDKYSFEQNIAIIEQLLYRNCTKDTFFYFDLNSSGGNPGLLLKIKENIEWRKCYCLSSESIPPSYIQILLIA